MTKTTATFDKSKPYGELHGVETKPGEPAPAFEQNNQWFTRDGVHVGSAGGEPKKAPAPVDVESGEGNLGHGQIPKFVLPIEEGGAGGGMTESFPQTTDKGKEILDATDDAGKTAAKKR